MTEKWFVQQADQSGGMTRLAEAAKATFWGLLGCEVIRAENLKSSICLDVQPHHLNLNRLVHGGVLASLIDNAMGLVVMQASPGDEAVTAHMNIHYLRSAASGLLTCDAELVHQSQRTFTLQANVYGDDGELLAWGSGSYRRM